AEQIMGVAGSHRGCFELFGTERVRAIRDLKGKTVAISGTGAPDHIFLSVILCFRLVSTRVVTSIGSGTHPLMRSFSWPRARSRRSFISHRSRRGSGLVGAARS